jgi:hypothetical protein
VSALLPDAPPQRPVNLSGAGALQNPASSSQEEATEDGCSSCDSPSTLQSCCGAAAGNWQLMLHSKHIAAGSPDT